VEDGIARGIAARVDDRDPLATAAHQETGVPHLPATERVEDRPLEFDPLRVHRSDLRAGRLQVGVVTKEQFASHQAVPTAIAAAARAGRAANS
jgi:hypothetical protein